MIRPGVLWPLGVALVGLLSGLLWKLPAVGTLDQRFALRIHQAAWPRVLDRGLLGLRFAGTTPFFLAVLVGVAILKPAWALGLALAAAAAEGLCKMVKVSVRRPRPFEQDERVVLRLARRPIDPSYPSADAMRVAFLGGLMMAASPAPCVMVACTLAALAVALGRVRVGAHYPLDAWAGLLIGLGVVLAWGAAL